MRTGDSPDAIPFFVINEIIRYYCYFVHLRATPCGVVFLVCYLLFINYHFIFSDVKTNRRRNEKNYFICSSCCNGI